MLSLRHAVKNNALLFLLFSTLSRHFKMLYPTLPSVIFVYSTIPTIFNSFPFLSIQVMKPMLMAITTMKALEELIHISVITRGVPEIHIDQVWVVSKLCFLLCFNSCDFILDDCRIPIPFTKYIFVTRISQTYLRPVVA